MYSSNSPCLTNLAPAFFRYPYTHSFDNRIPIIDGCCLSTIPGPMNHLSPLWTTSNNTLGPPLAPEAASDDGSLRLRLPVPATTSFLSLRIHRYPILIPRATHLPILIIILNMIYSSSALRDCYRCPRSSSSSTPVSTRSEG